MKVIIVEDEQGAARNLCDLLREIEPGIQILAVLESVAESLAWTEKEKPPDLGFFDIQIADGNSFEIFERSQLSFPVIFTTAFDEYALQAFKVNSIDYLMKPIKKQELKKAIEKYRSIYNRSLNFDPEKVQKLIQQIGNGQPKKYRKSFLVYVKDKIIPIATEKIAYFSLEHEIVYCYTHSQERYRIAQTLDSIQAELNPEDFFRVNRQFISSRKAIHSASVHFQRKLKLELRPKFLQEIHISKLKITAFKKWLEGD